MSNPETPATWQETLMLLVVPIIVFIIIVCIVIHFYSEKFDSVPEKVFINHSEIK